MTMPAGYAESDAARWVPEPPKSSARSAFARDRARVLHSSALRRLAAKTQVASPGSDDFGRTRLTHSLEVAQVGRDLATLLGCDPDVVDTACLAHDLGHPPFGHNGEAVLDLLADGIGGFEGNAQTLRLLTRLEPKILDPVTGRAVGLNLTRASLDAATKYPWPAATGAAGRGKFGVYAEDAEVFEWLRETAPRGRRCVEAQVMDLADDIAYCVHDIEDAIVAGFIDPAALARPDDDERVVRAMIEWYLPAADPAEATAALQRLRQVPGWVSAFDGSHRALAALKNMTSQLIGRFIQAAERATRTRAGAGPLTRYDADVVVPRDTLVEIAVMKAVAAVFVFTDQRRQAVYARQREIIAVLFEALLARAPAGLETPYADAWREAGDDAGGRRVVIDQVAGLTDASALARYEEMGRL